MKNRMLGELKVSATGLGCMGLSEFYGEITENPADVVSRAYELGINFYDTANIYGFGQNEILLGKIFNQLGIAREDIIIASKCGIVRDKLDPNKRGVDNSPEYIKTCCDKSLTRLNTDYIDLYYLHRIADKGKYIEESITALKELIDAGKIRHIGLCEVNPEIIRRAHQVHPITAIQSEYSLMTRNPETNGVLDVCRELNIGFVPYSPICRGLLTTIHFDASLLKKDDFRKNLPRFQEGNLKANMKIVAKIENIAQEKNCSVAQISLAWMLAQGDNIVPIPGTKHVKYLEQNIAALDIKLTEQDLDLLNTISPPDAAAGNRYSDAMLQTYNLEK